MKRFVLKEAQVDYTALVDEVEIVDKVVILEKEGHPVAAVVPFSEYVAYQSWQEAEARQQAHHQEEEAIAREHAALKQMQPELIKQYEGRVVALHNGQVVAVGDDRMSVWAQAREKLNGQPVYIQTIEKTPRIYKMPHRKTA